ncbi:hypothetical protein L1987_18457 [Smallanthus sonchifolius]|uniref:Uncharacterized protein n=1 Tax=Smallanthus sonchifolius TaxID=185202 RepID=A0ACB9J0U7_9ASTR|nr:hypothetical protein L1987_18457 [Smallanthus sonchifolius]
MAIIGRGRNSEQKKSRRCQAFLDLILSWSLSDLLNENLYRFQALNSAANMDIIQRTLSFTSVAMDCDKCCSYGEKDIIDLKLRQAIDSFKLNNSQEADVLSCVSAKKCCHENSCIKLVWGVILTDLETMTVASILFGLLRTNRRTLTCAPTNIAVVGVVKRLLCLLSDHDLGFDALGKSLSLWKTYTRDMICLLENPLKEYRRFIVSNPKKTKSKNKKSMKKNEIKPEDDHKENQLTFGKFAVNRFSVLSTNLITCIRNLYTHLPTSVIPHIFAKKMIHSIDLIQ